MRSAPPQALDPVSILIEQHLNAMSAEGLGELTVFEGVYGVALSFAGLSVSAETYDIGLLRLAGAILEDDRLASVFVAHLGGSTALKSAMR